MVLAADQDCFGTLLDVTYALQLQPEVRLEYISESVVDLTGYRQGDYTANPRLWLGAVDPRDRELMLTAFNADPSTSTMMNLRVRTRAGGSVWVHQIARTVVTKGDVLLLCAGLTRIPDPSESDAAVDGRYRMVAEGADDVVLETDRAGHVLWVSDSITSSGWSPQRLLGTALGELLAERDRGVVAEIHSRVLDGETVSGVIVRMVTADGKLRFISTTARPARDAQGHVCGAVLGWHDVDEVARAHRTAEVERQLLRATLDAQLDAQVLMEALRDRGDTIVDFRFIEANPAACRFLGLERQELVGQTVSDVDPGVLGGAEFARLSRVITERVPLVLNDFAYRPLNGRAGRFDLRAVPVDDGLAVTWRDVTERFAAAQALVESEQRYRVLLEESSDIVAFQDVDGSVRWISPAVRRLLGWSPDDAMTDPVALVHPDDLPMARSVLRELLGGEDSASTRLRLRRIDGAYRWMQATARAVRGERGEVLSIVVVIHDIQAQMDSQEALAASEARYRLLAEHATDVVYQVSVDGITEWVSDGVRSILGFSPQELIGKPGLDLIVPDDRERVVRDTEEALAGLSKSTRFRMPTKDGDVRWVEATVHAVLDDDGHPIRMVGGWRDIQAEVEAEQALDARARTDDLTGLVNRREALAQLVHSLSSGDSHRDQLAVAFCDIDRFKGINDSLGHRAGDRLLQIVVTRIQSCVRSEDIVARVGGDEILLILRGVRSMDDAMAIAEKVRLAVREPAQLDGQIVPTSISIGVTMAAADDDVDALVARADQAMYLAKEAGRDQVVRLT
jgi:diguanylate cyclase (GGDEF)-like protein/PAS domain S-box-containing protein